GAVVSLGGGTFAVRAGHNYAEEGNYALSVQVFDAGGSSVSGSGALTVADAALSGLSITDPGATEAARFSGFTVATFTDGNSGAAATDFTATVTWGDGPSSAASVAATGTPGVFGVLSGHTYAEEGPQALSVQVLDAGGSSVGGSLTFTVADAPLSLSIN